MEFQITSILPQTNWEYSNCEERKINCVFTLLSSEFPCLCFFLILKKSKKLETKKSEFPFAKKTLLLKKLKNLIEETVILEFLEFNSMILISLVIQRRT